MTRIAGEFTVSNQNRGCALAGVAILTHCARDLRPTASRRPTTTTYDVVIANGHVMDPESGLDASAQRRHHRPEKFARSPPSL